MSENRVHVRIVPDLSRLVTAFEVLASQVRRASEAMRKESVELWWQNRIIFADTKKERRLIQREYARATRRPSLIHKGRKP